MATLFPHSDSFSFFFVTFISLAVLSHRHPSATAAAGCQAPPVIFNFGDSNSDTGGLVAGLGYLVGLPNGRLFFRRSTGRLCDGRLLIDFLSQRIREDQCHLYGAETTFTDDKNSSSSRSRLAPARSRQTIKAFPIRRSRPDRRDPVPDCSSSFATSASIRSRPDRKQLDPIGVSSHPVRVQLAVHPSWWSGFQQTSRLKGNSKSKNL
uniref:GDSL esterase/lipase n=1 Tax=Brassica oleracea var. oleracea TaxID=109376 RepID=A0A0D3E5S5_BRAOL